jgi:PAS domain-containing protein
VLAELADEKAVADMIQAGPWDGAEKSLLNGADLLRTIWCTLNLHAIEPKRNLAEDSVRKLSCAVPQSADTIMIANSEGIIEYVNATFESLTAYSSEEAVGPTPSILTSAQQRRHFIANGSQSCGRGRQLSSKPFRLRQLAVKLRGSGS